MYYSHGIPNWSKKSALTQHIHALSDARHQLNIAKYTADCPAGTIEKLKKTVREIEKKIHTLK